MSQRSLRSRLRRTSSEEGFTLVEMLVTLMVMSIIAAAFLTVFSRVLTDSETVQARRDYLNEMRFAMETMTKQIRQATAIDTQQADYMGMDTLINGVEHHVHYRVIGTDLVRELDGGSAVTILSDLTTNAVFLYTTVDGTLQQVEITLTVDGGTRDVNLVSQVEMRNM
jgi:prepilin-type N-terminal cleavage/methylation domain-containing protein